MTSNSVSATTEPCDFQQILSLSGPLFLYLCNEGTQETREGVSNGTWASPLIPPPGNLAFVSYLKGFE